MILILTTCSAYAFGLKSWKIASSLIDVERKRPDYHVKYLDQTGNFHLITEEESYSLFTKYMSVSLDVVEVDESDTDLGESEVFQYYDVKCRSFSNLEAWLVFIQQVRFVGVRCDNVASIQTLNVHFCFSSADESTDGNQNSFNTKVKLNNNGVNLWLAPAIFKTACKINVEHFPFDEQVRQFALMKKILTPLSKKLFAIYFLNFSFPGSF